MEAAGVPKLAIIHTTIATVVPLKELAAELLPGCGVINFVDDSVLPQLAARGGDLNAVEERVLQYGKFAQSVGANVVLEACSSIGELVPAMRERLSIPVVRIDEGMAQAAVSMGSRIGVAATLSTTLEPTMRLIQSKALLTGRQIQLTTSLASDAYQRLLSGDQGGHDDLLRAALEELSASADVVVLAQASMARVVPRLKEGLRAKCLSSPRFAMEQVKRFVRGDHCGAPRD